MYIKIHMTQDFSLFLVVRSYVWQSYLLLLFTLFQINISYSIFFLCWFHFPIDSLLRRYFSRQADIVPKAPVILQ